LLRCCYVITLLLLYPRWLRCWFVTFTRLLRVCVYGFVFADVVTLRCYLCPLRCVYVATLLRYVVTLLRLLICPLRCRYVAFTFDLLHVCLHVVHVVVGCYGCPLLVGFVTRLDVYVVVTLITFPHVCCCCYVVPRFYVYVYPVTVCWILLLPRLLHVTLVVGCWLHTILLLYVCCCGCLLLVCYAFVVYVDLRLVVAGFTVGLIPDLRLCYVVVTHAFVVVYVVTFTLLFTLPRCGLSRLPFTYVRLFAVGCWLLRWLLHTFTHLFVVDCPVTLFRCCVALRLLICVWFALVLRCCYVVTFVVVDCDSRLRLRLLRCCVVCCWFTLRCCCCLFTFTLYVVTLVWFTLRCYVVVTLPLLLLRLLRCTFVTFVVVTLLLLPFALRCLICVWFTLRLRCVVTLRCVTLILYVVERLPLIVTFVTFVVTLLLRLLIRYVRCAFDLLRCCVDLLRLRCCCLWLRYVVTLDLLRCPLLVRCCCCLLLLLRLLLLPVTFCCCCCWFALLPVTIVVVDYVVVVLIVDCCCWTLPLITCCCTPVVVVDLLRFAVTQRLPCYVALRLLLTLLRWRRLLLLCCWRHTLLYRRLITLWRLLNVDRVVVVVRNVYLLHVYDVLRLLLLLLRYVVVGVYCVYVVTLLPCCCLVVVTLRWRYVWTFPLWFCLTLLLPVCRCWLPLRCCCLPLWPLPFIVDCCYRWTVAFVCRCSDLRLAVYLPARYNHALRLRLLLTFNVTCWRCSDLRLTVARLTLLRCRLFTLPGYALPLLFPLTRYCWCHYTPTLLLFATAVLLPALFCCPFTLNPIVGDVTTTVVYVVVIAARIIVRWPV